jgi:uncharacterized protein YdaU (DUF1376 family)
MAKAWMPLYIGDYLADTAHLTQGQHGAYMLFIMHYWVRGPIPAKQKQCMSIAQARTPDECEAAQDVLDGFFELRDGCYHHKRIDKELADAAEAYARRAAAAAKRWGTDSKAPAKPEPAKKVQSQPQSQAEGKPSAVSKPKKGEPKNELTTEIGNGAAKFDAATHAPNAEQVGWARDFTGWDESHLDDVRQSYTEYWTGPKGQKVKRTDDGWNRTWRTWVRAEARRTGFGGAARKAGSGIRPPAAEAHTSRAAGWAAAITERRAGNPVSERQAGPDGGGEKD